MSSLINAMDTMDAMTKLATINIEHPLYSSTAHQPIQINHQYGENSHIEYGWLTEIKENILQFYFQITQSADENTIHKLTLIYRNLIANILDAYSHKSKITKEDQQIAIMTIYKLIGQTRDIISGKGLYNFSYMMIAEWARYSIIGPPQYKEMCKYLAREAITSF